MTRSLHLQPQKSWTLGQSIHSYVEHSSQVPKHIIWVLGNQILKHNPQNCKSSFRQCLCCATPCYLSTHSNALRKRYFAYTVPCLSAILDHSGGPAALVQLCSNVFGKGIILHSAANSRISGWWPSANLYSVHDTFLARYNTNTLCLVSIWSLLKVGFYASVGSHPGYISGTHTDLAELSTQRHSHSTCQNSSHPS